MPNWSKLFYNTMYRFTRPDWDSGITPPEVIAQIARCSACGRALDLGCGTGTNSIYLAQQGFTTVGIDFSPKAIELACEKARAANVAVDFHIGDVTQLDFLREPFDFVLDVGCFHGLPPEAQARYAAQLARLTREGSPFLLYAFNSPTFLGRYGVTLEAAQRVFAPDFVLTNVEHGLNRHQRGAAWYEFRRQSKV